MYCYTLFGYQFISPISLSLPQSSSDGLSTFTISLGNTNPQFSDTAIVQCQPTHGTARIHWKQFEFLCSTDRTIHISPSVASSQEGVQLLTKSIIPIALMVCSEIILHASAFAYGGAGYLILGKSGTGKSTLASYAASQNSAHLGDDSVLLTEKEGAFYIACSGTGVYLDDDSFRYLSFTESDVKIYSAKGKRFVAPENFNNQPSSLLKLEKAVHLFHEGEASAIETAVGRLKILIDSIYMSDVMLSFAANHYLDTLRRLAYEVPLDSVLAKRSEQPSLKFQPTQEIYERIVS